MSDTVHIAKFSSVDSLSPEYLSLPLVNVESCKSDGRVHRTWAAHLIVQTASLIILDGFFETEIRHPLLGTIARGTRSLEFYWTTRWYSVFRFHEPDGHLRNFYCNINQPPEFDGAKLRFVDLDIDILVLPDMSFRVLDEDEFAANAARFNYSDDVRANILNAINELKQIIAARHFPFDFNA
ncbi:MAG: DUF402 domain-containing protein [Pyrinomonadaceae bacterium]